MLIYYHPFYPEKAGIVKEKTLRKGILIPSQGLFKSFMKGLKSPCKPFFLSKMSRKQRIKKETVRSTNSLFI